MGGAKWEKKVTSNLSREKKKGMKVTCCSISTGGLFLREGNGLEREDRKRSWGEERVTEKSLRAAIPHKKRWKGAAHLLEEGKRG